MSEWLSIEVFDGPFSATLWQNAHGDALTAAAIAHGARYWQWHDHRWGVVFEVLFDDDDAPGVFRGLPGVRAALDAVPDPVNGLLVYRGRGGGAGASVPRTPRPHPVAGAAALPEAEDGPRQLLPLATLARGGAGGADGTDGFVRNRQVSTYQEFPQALG